VAKRNDIAPYERREARKWTRVTDYVPHADAHVQNVHWPRPGTLPILREREVAQVRRRSARGLLLPVAAVAVAAALSLWGSGALETNADQQIVPAAATTSSGLRFDLCSEGGVTNCVSSGDSFLLQGKTVRIADIEAPNIYGAACPREAELGRRAALRLQALLNSGELEMTKVGPDLDSFGLLLRDVAVDGRDVGQAMVSEGLAREVGGTPKLWC
jgi:endonuclease YncB( thermonuclease family)